MGADQEGLFKELRDFEKHTGKVYLTVVVRRRPVRNGPYP
jgi:hypothetical protein